MRQAVLILILASSLCLTAQESEDMRKMKKELRIFSKILKESFSSGDKNNMRFGGGDIARFDDGNTALSPRHITATYLKDQGVLLTIDLEEPGLFPGSELYFQPRLQFDWDTKWSRTIPPGNMETMTTLEETTGIAQKLNAQIFKNLANIDNQRFGSEEQQKEIQKLKEDYEKLANEARAKAQETREQLLSDELAKESREKMEAELAALKDTMQRNAEENLAKIKEIQKEQRSTWAARVEAFEEELIKVLCEYGSTVYQLPDNEHFTVILSNADRSENNPQDKVFVFKKSDLLSCRDALLTPAELKTRSHTYTF